MAYPTRYLEALEYDPRPRLFGYQAPGIVRARALRLLEDRPEDDYLLHHAQVNATSYEPLRELIDSWHEDGTWGTDRFYMRSMGEVAAADKALRTTVRNLAMLNLYGWRVDPDEGYLAEAAEALLSRALEDGAIELISPDSNELCDEGVPYATRSGHWSGLAVAALLNLGIRDDRIELFLDMLESTQRHDGGWLPDKELLPTSENDESSLPSHPLHTINYALAFLAHPERRTGDLVPRATGFLLDAAFSQGSYRMNSEALWRRLSEPQWGFDALKVLWLAFHCDFGPEDNRVLRIARWLIDEQGSNGLWKSSRRHPGPDEDLFLALKATAAIKHLYDDLGAELEEE